MSSVKWVQGVVISMSLLLAACSGGGGGSGGDTSNSAPTAAITAPAAGSVYPENSSISFSGTGTDSEDGALGGTALEWSSSKDGTLGTGTPLVVTTLTTGNHTITLKVTDSGGKTDMDTISIMVNAAPVINSVTATPASMNIGVQTTFNWSIGDADGDTLTCGLDVDADGTDDYTINDCANNTSQVHTYAQAGDYQVRLTVTDDINAEVQQTVNVTVTGLPTNSPPQVSGFSATPDSPNTGSATTFSWTASDPDGDTLICGLDVNADGTDDYTINDCANNAAQMHTFNQAGSFQVRLSVSDGVNTPIVLTIDVTVTGEHSPSIDSFSAMPDTLATGASTTYSWSVSDTEGHTLTCELDINADGTIEHTINDCANNTSQAHTYTQAGTHEARLSVSDGIAPAVQSTVSVTVSTPPVISEFTMSPNPAHATVATTFYWQVSDADGDTLTCELDIDADGTNDYTIDDCANSASQGHTYAASGNYTTKLTVSDGISAVQTTLSSLEVVSPLLVDVSVNGPAVAGGRVPYTITVSNVSAQPMDDVSVVYTVPPALSFHYITDAEPDTNCGISCIDGEEALWTFDTLAAGESRTITINAPVVADALAGSLITAPVRVTSSDVIDIVNVSKTVAVNNDPMSQLAISASKDPVMPGDSLTLTFDVGNIDNMALDNLELRARLPAGITVDGISDGGSQDATTGEIVWDVSSLAVGNSLRRTVDITVDASAIAGQILATRAELRHDGGVALDTSAEYAVTVVDEVFPLAIDIGATPDPVAADGRLLYEITVSNTSAVPVNDVDVLLRVPPALSFHYITDAEPDTNCGISCIDGEEALWTFDTLAAGESRTITINAPVVAGALAGSLITAPVRVTSSDVIDIVNVSKTTAVGN